MKLRKVCAFAIAFILLGSMGSGAGEQRTQFFSFTFGPVEEVIGSCAGGFNVVNRFSGIVRALVRVDKDGTPVQEIDHFAFFDSVYYNDADPTLWFEGSEKPQTDRWVFADGKVYISGQCCKVRIPGEGVVFQTVGRWTFNLATGEFENWHGPDDYFARDVAALCRALTPR